MLIYNSQKDKNRKSVTGEKTPLTTKGSPLMGKPVSGNASSTMLNSPEQEIQHSPIPQGGFTDLMRIYSEKSSNLNTFMDNAVKETSKLATQVQNGEILEKYAQQDIQSIIDNNVQRASQDYATEKAIKQSVTEGLTAEAEKYAKEDSLNKGWDNSPYELGAPKGTFADGYSPEWHKLNDPAKRVEKPGMGVLSVGEDPGFTQGLKEGMDEMMPGNEAFDPEKVQGPDEAYVNPNAPTIGGPKNASRGRDGRAGTQRGKGPKVNLKGDSPGFTGEVFDDYVWDPSIEQMGKTISAIGDINLPTAISGTKENRTTVSDAFKSGTRKVLDGGEGYQQSKAADNALVPGGGEEAEGPQTSGQTETKGNNAADTATDVKDATDNQPPGEDDANANNNVEKVVKPLMSTQELMNWGKEAGFNWSDDTEDTQAEKNDPYAGMSEGTKSLMKEFDDQQKHISNLGADGKAGATTVKEKEDWSLDMDFVKGIGYFLFGLAASGGNPFFAFGFANEGFQRDSAATARKESLPRLLQDYTEPSAMQYISSGDAGDLVTLTSEDIEERELKQFGIDEEQRLLDNAFRNKELLHKENALKVRQGELKKKGIEDIDDQIKFLEEASAGDKWEGTKRATNMVLSAAGNELQSNRSLANFNGAFAKDFITTGDARDTSGKLTPEKYPLTGWAGDFYLTLKPGSKTRAAVDNVINSAAGLEAYFNGWLDENVKDPKENAKLRSYYAKEVDMIQSSLGNQKFDLDSIIQTRDTMFPSTGNDHDDLVAQALKRKLDPLDKSLRAGAYRIGKVFGPIGRERLGQAFNTSYMKAEDWTIDPKSGQDIFKMSDAYIQHIKDTTGYDILAEPKYKGSGWIDFDTLASGVLTTGREDELAKIAADKALLEQLKDKRRSGIRTSLGQ